MVNLPVQLNGQPRELSAGDISPFFTTFKSSLLRDFEKIAIEKGLTVKAAYESLDAMTYDDKKSVHFAIVPEVKVVVDAPTKCTSSYPLFIVFAGSYACMRDLTIGRTFSVSLLEPQSREKLYIKNLNLDSTRTSCQASAEFRSTSGGVSAYTLVQDALKTACQAAVNRELDQLYNEAVKAFTSYLPYGEEAQRLKAQALEIKSKKVY